MLLGMQVARVGQQTAALGLVLFTLVTYGSPELAGMVVFVGLVPGILVSPVAGALLDRHGRTRLIVLDLVVSMSALALVAGLALAGILPAWLLLLIAAVASLTAPLTNTGLRSLFPLIVPRRLWERANAVDANLGFLAQIVGPAIGGVAIQALGAPFALLAIGCIIGLAALLLRSAPDPPTDIEASAGLWQDTVEGLGYWWRNRALRGLGFTYLAFGGAFGTLTIALPVLAFQRFEQGPAVVGGIFALMGASAASAALMAGRMHGRQHERLMLIAPGLATAVAMLMLLVASDLTTVALAFVVIGLVQGPMQVALFTLRQRRTDPQLLGRAFAISGSFNAIGSPIGSAVAGLILARSVAGALVFGAACGVLSSVLVTLLVPSHE